MFSHHSRRIDPVPVFASSTAQLTFCDADKAPPLTVIREPKNPLLNGVPLMTPVVG